MHAVDDGTPIPVADGALDPLGLPMSPFELLALVGPAVQLHVMEVLQREWPERYPVSDNLRRLVEHGVTSVYPPERQPGAARELLPGIADLLQVKDSPWEPADVLKAVRDGLADEVRRMLDEGVVAGREDIDLAMMLGAGWPAHLGGVTPYLQRTGGF
jgi:3-hydroxyacyl-CoA dehydrogenase